MVMIVNDGMECKNGKGYFIDRDSGDLMVYDIESKSVEDIMIDNGKNMFRKYRKAIYKDDCIFCIPDTYNQIRQYHLNSKENQYFDFGGDVRHGIVDAWIVGKTLWCVSIITNKVIEFDLQLGCKIAEYMVFGAKRCGFKATMDENHIYIVSMDCCDIVKFNIINKKQDIIKVDIEETGFNTVEYNDGKLYLTGYNSYLYLLNAKTGKMINRVDIPLKFYINDDSYEEDFPTFINTRIEDGNIILFFSNVKRKSCYVLVINELDGFRVMPYEIPNSGERMERYVFEYFYQDRLVVLGEDTATLYEIDLTQKKVRKIDVEYRKSIVTPLINRKGSIYEGKYGLSLNYLIEDCLLRNSD